MKREADRQRGKLRGGSAETNAPSAAATPTLRNLAGQSAAEAAEEQARAELISLRRRMYELDLDSAAESLPIG